MHCVMDCNAILFNMLCACISGRRIFVQHFYTMPMIAYYNMLCCSTPTDCCCFCCCYCCCYCSFVQFVSFYRCTIGHFISHLLSATGAICVSSLLLTGFSFLFVFLLFYCFCFCSRFHFQRIDNEFGASSAKGSVEFHTKPFKADPQFFSWFGMHNVMWWKRIGREWFKNIWALSLRVL